jgi:predicted transcriptional regulator of viral defense system
MPAQEGNYTRSAGAKASLVLEQLAERRRRSIQLSEDRPWLQTISPDPNSLLERMADAGLLYRIHRGRYLVAPRGSFSPTQAAPAEFMAGLLLEAQGGYYIGYLSALIGHRLTDLHSKTVYAAIRQTSTFTDVEVGLPGGLLRVVRLSESRWPQDEQAELERLRAMPDSKEFVWQSNLERTLVDALARPDMSAGIETVVGCWASARERDVDWERVCSIAARYGKSMVRRVAFILRVLGLQRTARQNFPDLTGRGASTPLDRTGSFGLDLAELKRDRDTGVVINVPEDYLLGWIGAAALP